MKHLYFVRHGESELNVAQVYAGQIDTPLTDHGREQAQLAGEGARNLQFDLIVSSPLSRALETAQIIAVAVGYPKDKIVINDTLMERSYGSLAGQPWSVQPNPAVFPDIESDAEMTARAQIAFEFIKDLDVDTVLVVSHGDFAKYFRLLIDPSVLTEELPNAQIVQLI